MKVKLSVLIKRFDIAAQSYAFVGACHPDERDEIRKYYKDLRKFLLAYAKDKVINVKD